MTFLKVLGWIFIPYVMIFIDYKKMQTTAIVFGVIWSIFAFFFFSPFALFLGLIAAILSGDEVETQTPPAKPVAIEKKAPEQKAKPAAKPKIEDTVKVDDFEYTILSAKSAKVVKGSFGKDYKPGAGQYIIIEAQVKNTGKEKEYVDNDLFVLKDKDGAEYSVDSDAMIWMDKEDDYTTFVMEEINPHSTKKGLLVFDVPERPVDSFICEVKSPKLFSSEKAVIELKK